MPEGDVVLRTARRLDAALRGHALVTADLRWPSLATVRLEGRTVTETVARGKHLLTRLEGGLTLHSHLRMEGSWHLHRTGEPWRGRSEQGIRAVLANAKWTAIGHRLGMLDLVPTPQENDLVGHLGPDVLGADWDLDDVMSRAATTPERPVGEVLLDQRVLAGVGTFYMTETLFLRGVSPWTPLRDVGDVAAAIDLARRLMSANLDRAVQVTTGDAHRGAREFVHGRSGRPCRRCATTIRVASIGVAPADRVAFWCPRCQPGPTPTDAGRPQRPLGAGGSRGTPAATDQAASTSRQGRPEFRRRRPGPPQGDGGSRRPR